jgi:DNA helicase-2/ATP-dependent DNA helicase PcrA
LASGPRGKIASFVALLERFQGLVATLSLADLATRIIQDTGYAARLQEERSDEAEDRLANLQELVSALTEFERSSEETSLAAFLEQVALISDLERGEKGQESATLMTLHSAKGLEFPLVFIIGMEERLFPHVRALDDPEQMEEERRLCYVGVTRAKDRLYLLHTFRRTLYGESEIREPSRYLQDIPPNLLRGWKDKQPARQPSLGPETGRFLGRTPAGTAAPRPSEPAPTPRWQQRETQASENRGTGPRAAEAQHFQPGDRVVHKVFGAGIVTASKPVGGDEEVTVAFPGVGLKRLLASMAPMEKAEKDQAG